MIDTPGLDDTRGIEQDTRNLHETFATLAQYKQLSAICILLKPDEPRFTIGFEYCINEILRHLPNSVQNNPTFIFTHTRPTFYKPGNTKRLLEVLFKKHYDEQQVEIPLNMNNKFLFENDSFRYLALRKHRIQLGEEEAESYYRGWKHSVKVCSAFLIHVVRCPLYEIQQIISLDNAEQLICKLPRPLAEIQRQIAENLERARKFKEKVKHNPEVIDDGAYHKLKVVFEN